MVVRKLKLVTHGYLYDEEKNTVIQYNLKNIMENGKAYGDFGVTNEFTREFIYGSYDRDGSIFIISPIDEKTAFYIEAKINEIVEAFTIIKN